MRPRPPPAVPPRLRLKTYSHLSAAQRVPNDYEVATTRLLYHPERGLELQLPFAAWYQSHQRGSELGCDDWEKFADPRRTTYARYTTLMSRREAFVEELLERMEREGYDERLSPDARRLFGDAVAPLRYPLHGLQMVAAYLGQLAPSGRIAVVCAFQAADETRRVQRIAYRLGQLRRGDPAFGLDGRERWQSHRGWQPLRRAVERLLVTWDFGEALVGLQLCVKARLDRWIHGALAARARALGDTLFAEVLTSLDDDACWHREWTSALLTTAIEERAGNLAPLARWLARWTPPAREAVAALGDALGDGAGAEAANLYVDRWLARLPGAEELLA